MDQAIPNPAVEVSPVVELRQYTLQPGTARRADDAVREEVRHRPAGHRHAHARRVPRRERSRTASSGCAASATCRSAPRALEAFYGGPVWQEHRNEANATMVDASNVLLLQPADGGGFTLARKMTATMVATIYLLQSPVDDGFLRFFKERVQPVMEATGATPVAELKTLNVAEQLPQARHSRGRERLRVVRGLRQRRRVPRRTSRSSLPPTPRRRVERDLKPKLASRPAAPRAAPHAADARSQPRALPATRSTSRAGLHDFDFIDGEWTSKQWRLKQRGVGSSEWDTTYATHWAKVLLGGVANVDTVDFPDKGWSG